jgi:sugar lactone lactonase YvrE
MRSTRWTNVSLVMGLGLILGAMACGGGGGGGTSGPGLEIVRFTASPAGLFPGSKALLSATYGGGSATVDPGGAPLASGGSMLTPAVDADTTFTLDLALAGGGTQTAQAGVALFRTLGEAAGVAAALGVAEPVGVAVDPHGNVYVADFGSDTIDLLAPAAGPGGTTTWTLSTIAGISGQPGHADGPLGSSTFNGPAGLALDAAGNLYVTDYDNDTIRLLTPATPGGTTGWTAKTIAGTALQSGHGDGALGAALFDGPSGLAVDGAGNVYVADTRNNTIRLLTPAVPGGTTTWTVSTIAGTAGQFGYADGALGIATFWNPLGVALDSRGRLYVADSGTSIVRLLMPPTGGATTWTVSTIAGSATAPPGSADGPGTDGAAFDNPYGTAVDAAGNVYVADAGGNTIRLLTPPAGSSTSWTVSTIAGSALHPGSADGPRSTSEFTEPGLLAVDAAGNLFVADTGNGSVRLLKPATVDGATTWTVSTPLKPMAGHTDSAAGTPLFDGPDGVAVDGSGSVYVADTGNSTIRLLTPATAGDTTTWTVSTIAGIAGTASAVEGGLGTGTLDRPEGVAVDAYGYAYVADTGNSTIRLLTPPVAGHTATWTLSTIAGVAGPNGTGSTDGVLGVGLFRAPQSLAVDGNRNIFVADSGNNTIRLLTAATSGGVTAWTTSTIAGNAALPAGSQDGPGTGAGGATFDNPDGIAVDRAGNVYVADYGNNTIRLLTPSTTGGVTTWTVSTIAGNAALPAGSQDGPGTGADGATFNGPNDLAVDAAGSLYVADYGNDTIRLLTPATSGGVTTWTVATVVGAAGVSAVAPGALPATFYQPNGVALDPVSGRLYLTAPNLVMVVR